MPHKQVPVLEQVGDPLLLPRDPARRGLLLSFGPSARLLGELGRQLLAQLGRGVQDCFEDFLESVTCAGCETRYPTKTASANTTLSQMRFTMSAPLVKSASENTRRSTKPVVCRCLLNRIAEHSAPGVRLSET